MKELAIFACKYSNTDYKERYKMLYMGKNNDIEEPTISDDKYNKILKLIENKPIKKSKRISKKNFNEKTKINFGKFKGKTWENVLENNRSYIEWVAENFSNEKTRKYAKELLK